MTHLTRTTGLREHPDLAVVIPAWNERENIELLLPALKEMIAALGLTAEIIVALDLVLAMVQAARSYGRKKGLLGSYVVGNAVSPPFCDACFDGVAMLGAIIAHVPGRDGRVQAFRDASFDGVAMLGAIIAHVPGRDGRVQAFRAAWRTLRPGGKLAMTTHNRRCHWKLRLYFACVNRFRRLGRRLGLWTSLGDNDRWSTRISEARSRRPVFFHM